MSTTMHNNLKNSGRITEKSSVIEIIEEAKSLVKKTVDSINVQILANADSVKEQLKIKNGDERLFDAMLKEPFKMQIGRLSKINLLLGYLESKNNKQ